MTETIFIRCQHCGDKVPIPPATLEAIKAKILAEKPKKKAPKPKAAPKTDG